MPQKRKTINRKNGQPKKGIRPLTDKERKYVMLRTSNPKMTKVRAVMETYNTKTPTVAGNIAWELEKKPKIQNALLAHSKLAEETIVQAIMDYKESDKQWQRTLAVETSKWVHDKLHGKAVQKSHNVNQNFTEHISKKQADYDL
jgi:hypothetical protein